MLGADDTCASGEPCRDWHLATRVRKEGCSALIRHNQRIILGYGTVDFRRRDRSTYGLLNTAANVVCPCLSHLGVDDAIDRPHRCQKLSERGVIDYFCYLWHLLLILYGNSSACQTSPLFGSV